MSLISAIREIVCGRPVLSIVDKLDSLYIDILNANKQDILSGTKPSRPGLSKKMCTLRLSDSSGICYDATVIPLYEGARLPVGYGADRGKGFNILDRTAEVKFYSKADNKKTDISLHTDVKIFKVNGKVSTLEQFFEFATFPELNITQDLLLNPRLDLDIKIFAFNKYFRSAESNYNTLKDDYIDHPSLDKARNEYKFFFLLEDHIHKIDPYASISTNTLPLTRGEDND